MINSCVGISSNFIIMATNKIGIKKTQLRSNDKNEEPALIVNHFSKLFKTYETNVI